METCPWCDRAFEGLPEMANHLLAEHARQKVNGNRLVLSQSRMSVRCWCGAWLRHQQIFAAPAFEQWATDHSPTGWTRHLARAGGVEAHILKLTLLGKEG